MTHYCESCKKYIEDFNDFKNLHFEHHKTTIIEKAKSHTGIGIDDRPPKLTKSFST